MLKITQNTRNWAPLRVVQRGKLEQGSKNAFKTNPFFPNEEHNKCTFTKNKGIHVIRSNFLIFVTAGQCCAVFSS